MSQYPRFVLTWVAVVLGFDAAASLTSLVTGLPYGWFTVGSVLIYVTSAYRGGTKFGFRNAVVATVILALVDATAGWAISWLIGPGQVAEPGVSIPVILLSGAIGAFFFGGITGSIGAGIAAKRRPPPLD